MKLRTIALGLTAAATLALPASAMADTSMLDSLSGPAHIDGHTYSPAQMQHRSIYCPRSGFAIPGHGGITTTMTTVTRNYAL